MPTSSFRVLAGLALLSCTGGGSPSPEPGPGLADLDADDDGYLEFEDCDEDDPDVHPGAVEICDEIDNDCDGEVDESVMGTYYSDADGDGYGDDLNAIEACSAPEGTVSVGGDCDDGDGDIRPGADEVCDTVDQDCNGEPDDGDVCLCEVSAREGAPYQFCDFAATWSKAREICQQDGYDLVSIDGQEEQAWLVETASLQANFHWWIGLSDEDETDDWEWVEGLDLTEEAFSWCEGEPDHWGEGCGEEAKAHCVVLEGQEGGCWRDRICDCARSYFICEATETSFPESGR